MAADLRYVGLNALYGARCFLTSGLDRGRHPRSGLNAPYGARCFLTASRLKRTVVPRGMVLMHLMALGAF